LRIEFSPANPHIRICGRKELEALHPASEKFIVLQTKHGAYIGDMFMSLIHTCNLMRVNPFDYLVTLIKNSSALFKDPSKWMPWNYKTNES
jgi:hypothetical protein